MLLVTPAHVRGLLAARLPELRTMNWDTFQFWSQHYFAPWVQDDWKISRKLTMNLGLRWDFTTPETERHNKMNGAFDPSVLNPVSAMVPTGTAALGTNTNLEGGLTFAGVNGQSRALTK